jgi:hypothetical protein
MTTNDQILESINEIGCRMDDELDRCRVALRDAEHVLKGANFVLSKIEEYVKSYKDDIQRKARMNASPTQQQVQQNLINELTLQQITNMVQVVKNENVAAEKIKSLREGELATTSKMVTLVKKYYDEMNEKLFPVQVEPEQEPETIVEPEQPVETCVEEQTITLEEQNVEEKQSTIAAGEIEQTVENVDSDVTKTDEETPVKKKEKKNNSVVELSRQLRDKRKSKKDDI